MARSVCRLIVIPFALMSASTAMAAGGLGLTAKIGTLGYGIEATTGLTDTINLRFGYQGISTDFDYDYQTDNGVTANFKNDLDMSNASLLVDWHSFGGGFRFSGGVMSNGFKLEGTAPEADYQIGDNTYTTALGATFETENSAAPYLGIGWGNAVGKDQRWVFSADLGVLYSGSFNVDLTATGVPEDDIAKEEAKIQDDLNKYELLPVATVGVSYHF